LSCRAGRVRHIAQEFTQTLRAETDQRLAGGTLAIHFDEPKVEAARVLLALDSTPEGTS